MYLLLNYYPCRCKATNDFLKKTRYSKAALVSITISVAQTEVPTILPLDNSLNKTILVGENLKLYCAVSGWPSGTVQWTDGKLSL